MAECTKSESSQITLLPTEILYMILKHNNCREILNFGATCRRFNELVNNGQYLWKAMLKNSCPRDIYGLVEKYGNGHWQKELKRYFSVKYAVHLKLLSMSSRYYWRTTEISIIDIKEFFTLALSHNSNHYYVVTILKDLIKIGSECLNSNSSYRPYTLTEMYYAKIVLRYLTQTYLVIKWFQNLMRNVLTPDLVLNFFLEWVVTDQVHAYEDIEATFSKMIEDVKKQYPKSFHPEYTVQEKVSKGFIKPSNLLVAVADVIYKKNHIRIKDPVGLDTLHIPQVWKKKRGDIISIAVMYQAVADRCGVHCELIAFPNHLFLEWHDPSTPGVVYKVDLLSGAISQKGRCPYERRGALMRNDIKFCPNTFLQYIVSSFLMSIGTLKNVNAVHARNLQDFLSTECRENNPYKYYQAFLLDYDTLPVMSITLNPQYLHESHLKMLEHLMMITYSPSPVTRVPKVTERRGDVKFAVGMICYHQRYDYVCVILGWDPVCSINMGIRQEFQALRYGLKQTFYNVVANDQSERYVAQEYLIDVPTPNRLHHLEDIIAKYFTHYDGYCYNPNDQLESEYPNDRAVRNVYKDRFDLRNECLRELAAAGRLN